MPLVGVRVKQLRLARQFTQAEVGQAMGVSQQQIARWEMGNLDVTVESAARLAKLLECTSDYLIGLSDAPNAHIQPQALSADEWKLVDLYRRRDLPTLILRLSQELVGRKAKTDLAAEGEDETILPKRLSRP